MDFEKFFDTKTLLRLKYDNVRFSRQEVFN